MDYEKLTVANLRSILKERGIASTGLSRKAQIIEKLREVDAEADDTVAQVEEEAQGEEQAEEIEAVEEEKPAPIEEQIVTPEILLAEKQTAIDDSTELPKEPSAEASAPIQEPVATEAQTQPQPVPTTEIEQDIQPATTTTQVSGTETALSTQPNSDIESSRKRKRRSASPPPDTQELSKKAKVLEEVVHLKEDEESTLPPSDIKIEEVEESKPPLLSSEQPKAKDDKQVTVEMEVDSEVEPAIHPPTRALYIRNFSRPLQPTALKRHLAQLASPNPTEETIVQLHLDSIRTHAFIILDTVSSAQSARNGMHGKVWPDEKNRKELWADFVPEEMIQGWIDQEDQAKGGGLTRWEISYTTLDDGVVEAALREEGGSAGGLPSKNSSSKALPSKTAPDSNIPDRFGAPPVSKPVSKTQEPIPASFATLDTLFKSTSTSKPMLYYLPISSSLADSRLKELSACTSKQWPPHRSERRDYAPPRHTGARMSDDEGVEGELRRYTFEEGDKLVDGGVHRFGAKAREAEKGRIGGGRGGGGGGFVPRGPRGHRGGGRFGGGDRFGGGGGGGRRFGGGWR